MPPIEPTDDPPVRAAEQGQCRLRDGHLPEDVDLQQPAQVVSGEGFQRGGKPDAGVVDDAVEPGAGQLALDRGERRRDRLVGGDVEREAHQPRPVFSPLASPVNRVGVALARAR